jgi:hypothetical protein
MIKMMTRKVQINPLLKKVMLIMKRVPPRNRLKLMKKVKNRNRSKYSYQKEAMNKDLKKIIKMIRKAPVTLMMNKINCNSRNKNPVSSKKGKKQKKVKMNSKNESRKRKMKRKSDTLSLTSIQTN